jgi:hypothetical protein
MGDGKILIMGTGGCGSGFVWNLLKRCGLETTEHREWMRSGEARDKAPKVIKHLGGFLNNLNHHVDNNEWEIEHIFFTVATLDLHMDIQKRRLRDRGEIFYYDMELEKYYTKLGKGIAQLAERDYPFTIIRCPTSIQDSLYCYNKLKVVLGDTLYECFSKIHSELIIPELASCLSVYKEK